MKITEKLKVNLKNFYSLEAWSRDSVVGTVTTLRDGRQVCRFPTGTADIFLLRDAQTAAGPT
jgi:hypothetical protein